MRLSKNEGGGWESGWRGVFLISDNSKRNYYQKKKKERGGILIIALTYLQEYTKDYLIWLYA